MKKHLIRVLTGAALFTLVGLNVGLVVVWWPYRSEAQAANVLAEYGVTTGRRVAFPDLFNRAIRKIVPADYSRVCERVVSVGIPAIPRAQDARPSICDKLPSFSHLETLSGVDGPLLVSLPRLSRVECVSVNKDGLTNDHMIGLRAVPNLRRLSLRDANVSDKSLDVVSRLTGLVRLDLSGTKVTLSGLVELESLKNLQRLDLSYTTASGSQKLNPRGMPSLRELSLRGVSMRDEDLRRIVRWAPSLESLELPETSVTDQGIKCVAALPNLRALNVASTKVTGQSQETLVTCSSLRLVVFDADQFSSAAVSRMRHQRPDMVLFSL